MEGLSSHDDHLQLMSPNFGGNAASTVSQATREDPNQQVIMAGGRTPKQTDALSLPWWTQTSNPSHSYVEYLAESSTFIPKAPYEDTTESIPSFTGIHGVDGVSEFQRDVLCSSLENAHGSELTDFYMDMDTRKNLRFSRPHNELVNTQNQIHGQFRTSRRYNSNGDAYDSVSQIDPRTTVSAPTFLSQPCHNTTKPRASGTDRSRRMRIAERLNALQELLPESTKGDQVSSLDDVIDHVKFLQLQIKDLCRSRLGVESIAEPIIFREGYGHYFCRGHIKNEPLEEMMGNLLETDPPTANQLLEDKGLLLLPIDYSEYLS